jgi:hypothetical protein
LGDRPYVSQRLAETGRMVFDALDPTTVPRAPGGAGGPDAGAPGAPGSLHPASQGYLTVRGVRLLHALVRQTLLNRHDDPWPLERRGLPINQEDMLGALLTFTVTVLDGLERLGIPVTPVEAHAYVHTWRVIGALLGIDEALLPATVGEARAAAAALGRRQLGPSRDGTALAGELVKEMRLAMPAGCRELPGALVHRLVPDVADLLGVPRPGPVWRGVVDHAALLAHRCQGVPGVRELVAAGPGAVVGRSVLLLFMDRQDQAGPPAYRVEAGQLLRRARGRGGWRRVARRTARRQRRGDTIGRSGPAGAPTGPVGVAAPVVLPAEVALPIDADDVRHLASEGFTLWEPVGDLVRRNRRITVAYADLSRGLAKIIADGDEVLDANWCTFATWSSKTIGTFIEQIPERGVPRPPIAGGLRARFSAQELTRRAMVRTNGSSFRTLAAGNRVVFLEIGLSIATFIEQFRVRIADEDEDAREARWASFWTTVAAQLEAFASLNLSWLPTVPPQPDDLRHGLREYFEALHTDDPDERSEHVLAGNLRLAAYEQRRVDGYVWAALALFTQRAIRRLLCDRTGRVGGVRRWGNCAFALVMTRRMELQLPGGEVLRIGEPVPPPPARDDWCERLATDASVTLPELQALITLYELESRGRRPEGCRNWTSFDERMRTIGRLFRSRQRQASLFDDPFGITAAGQEKLGSHPLN